MARAPSVGSILLFFPLSKKIYGSSSSSSFFGYSSCSLTYERSGAPRCRLPPSPASSPMKDGFLQIWKSRVCTTLISALVDFLSFSIHGLISYIIYYYISFMYVDIHRIYKIYIRPLLLLLLDSDDSDSAAAGRRQTITVANGFLLLLLFLLLRSTFGAFFISFLFLFLCLSVGSLFRNLISGRAIQRQQQQQ